MNDLLRGWLDLPPQASTYAAAVDLLHFFVIGTALGGATLIFLLAIYFLVRYRQTVPHATTTPCPTSLTGEICIIGGLETLFLGFWVVGAILYNHMMTPPADSMVVYVTGKQWMWKFSYPDGRASLDVLTVPVGRPIKLVMTSRDVIHSFYVPAFRIKHDAVPGRYYTLWFEANTPGIYDVDCAEYCGVDHSRMLGKVQVLARGEYAQWLEGTPVESRESLRGATAVAGGPLARLGREVATKRGCVSCHTVDGQPAVGPTWAGLYGSSVALTDGTQVRADDAYLTRSMMDPQVQIVSGYRPVMPTYRGVLEQPEVGALVEYIRSLHSVPFRPSVRLPQVEPLNQGQPQNPAP